MKVLSIRPLHAGNALARFDIELPGGFRLFNLKLSQTPRGLRVHSASAFGNSTATFTPEAAEAIIRRTLGRFYEAVAAENPVSDTYVQIHAGDAIRSAFIKHNPLSGQAHGAAMAMAEMPEHWPSTYRASVWYHLAPLLDDVVNS